MNWINEKTIKETTAQAQLYYSAWLEKQQHQAIVSATLKGTTLKALTLGARK